MNEQTAKEIKGWYIKGKGSIQDLARIYRVTVEEVLELIGESGLGTVTTQGDMVDPSEAGPGVQLEHGKDFKVPFDVS